MVVGKLENAGVDSRAVVSFGTTRGVLQELRDLCIKSLVKVGCQFVSLSDSFTLTRHSDASHPHVTRRSHSGPKSCASSVPALGSYSM